MYCYNFDDFKIYPQVCDPDFIQYNECQNTTFAYTVYSSDCIMAHVMNSFESFVIAFYFAN